MNTKIISIIGLMAIAIGAWFFYKEDVEIKPTTPTAPSVSYEVSEIKAVSTNAETGKTEYTVTAKSLVKNSAGVDEMKDAKIIWTPPEGDTFELTTKTATLSQETGDLLLKEGFVLIRKGTKDKPDMVIEGEVVQGNTKTKLLSSDKPITVTQGTDTFVAQGFNADLKTGEYEFNQVAMEFMPPKRTDKPLF